MNNTQVTVTQEVWDGIVQVWASGENNMFDYPRVIQWLHVERYHEAAEWIEENPEAYARLIFHGMVIGEESDVDA